MVGQCVPSITNFKFLFGSSRHRNSGSDNLRDCQAELQLIWQEIGDNKNQRLQELQKAVSAAINNIYERTLEENMMRKKDLKDMVAQTEVKLKEHLGPSASEMIASQHLPLQDRLNSNLKRLKVLEELGITEKRFIEGLSVLEKLYQKISVFRKTLRLPPCDNAKLDEMLIRTVEDIRKLCPEKFISDSVVAVQKSSQKPIIQHMHQFHHALCAFEDFRMRSFSAKDTKNVPNRRLSGGQSVQRSFQKEKYSSTCRTKYPSSATRPLALRTGNVKLCHDETSDFNNITNKILRKLERFNKQSKAVKSIKEKSLTIDSPSSRHAADNDLKAQSIPASLFLNTEETRTRTAHFSRDTRAHRLIERTSKNCDSSAKTKISSSLRGNELCSLKAKDAGMMPNKSNLDVKASAELGDNENKRCPPNEIIRFGHDGAYNSVSTERKSSSPSKSNLHLPEQTFLSSSKSKPSQPSPPPLPPPPPPLPYPRPSSLRPSSPPPAPAPPSTDSIRPQSSQTLPLTPPQRPTMKSASITRSSRLRKSPTIGRIHLEMKKKIEGLPSSKSQQTDVAMKHRTTGNNSRDGMAKAVAEITRRSAYFQKIDDDVHKYTESILTVKSRLETFETANMHHLTQFQSEIEAHLEQLSDETQVLARFDRFPIQKLECVRAAASLYLKLTSTTNQIEKWDIESPLSEQFEKVNAFFDKVKTDVEAVERAKEDNNRRFSSHKIYFDFGILTSIKEAAVDLSSRCLSSALAESQTIRSNVKMGEQLCNRDMNKLMAVFQVLYKAFLFAFKVHNFAGGHDDKAEHLSSQLALEMDLYPPSFWSQLAN